MSNSHEAISHSLNTEDQIFRTKLSAYTILDLCILESVAKTSKGIFGVLRSSRISADGTAPRYTNVELLNVGSSRGGFIVGGDSEDLYLVFCTASSMMSSITRKIDSAAGAYSSSAMKGIPVSSMLNWISNAGFDRSGNFIITLPGSNLTFNVDSSIKYQHQGILKFGKNADGSMYIDMLAGRHQFFLMSDTSWYKCSWAADGKIQEIFIHATTGVETRRRWSTSVPSNAQKMDILNFTDFLYEEIFLTSGEVTITHKNSSGSVVGVDSFSAAGIRQIDGTELILRSISAGGAQKAIIKLTGKIAVGNTAQDLLDLIDELVDCAVNIGTVGSAAAQTINPASIAQFEAARVKAHLLIEAS